MQTITSPHLMDNSQLLTYLECGLQYKYKYMLGLKKMEEGESEHDRNYGGAIHKALAHWNLGGESKDSIEKFKLAYPDQLDESDLAKTQEHGVILLEKYFSRYGTDREKYRILGVEELIDFKVGGITFNVKCDTIIQDLKYGQIYSLEHKTTKKTLDYKYWSQYDPNAQLCAQTAGIKSKYGECAGVIVDALAFGFRQRASKYGPAGFHMDFGRTEFNRNVDQLKLWEESTIKTVENLTSDMESGRWDMNTGACWKCTYKPICSAAWTFEQDKELILLSYEQRDPFSYLTEDQNKNGEANLGAPTERE